MDKAYTKRFRELKKIKERLERQLKIKIQISGPRIIFDGPALGEYTFSLIINAIDFGFSGEDATLLLDEEVDFKIINIKDITRRKNLSEVKGRIIGTHRRTLNTIEQIAGCKARLKDNEVGIIGYADHIDEAITALTNLIRGSKQSNVYKFLERQNTKHKQNKNKI